MNDFFGAATRRLATPLPVAEAAAVVEGMSEYTCVPVDATLVRRAIHAGQQWQLSHWDALMVEAARQVSCTRLVSEDLPDGAR